MKKFKKIILAITVVLSFNLNASNLNSEHYEKIENTFINYAISKGENVTKIDVDDFRRVTDEEKQKILIQKEKNPKLNELFDIILEGNWSNNNMIYNSGDETALLYPNRLKPLNYQKDACNYINLITDINNCLATYIAVKENLANVMNNNKIYLSDTYLSDFLYIHELSHLIPSQRNVPEFDTTNLWIDDVVIHYGEMYSDLFAVIFLNNYLGYDEKDIQDIIKLRDFKLHSKPDLIHYSVPYINLMLENEEWKELKSFDDIDEYIKNIYVNYNNNNIVSKKRFKNIYYNYYNFCEGFNYRMVASGNIVDFMKIYCKKSK